MWWPTNHGDRRLFDWPQTAETRDATWRAWKRLVLAHPFAYLHHRLIVFANVLTLTSRYGSMVFTPVWRERLDVIGNPVPNLPIQDAIADVLEAFKHTPIYRPFVYFFLAIAFLGIARRHRDTLALLTSGLLYELTFIPFAPSPEYRYSHWMITCTVIATVILIKRRMELGSDGAR
jgi:hypothetical protein